jgi:hypothetical protein
MAVDVVPPVTVVQPVAVVVDVAQPEDLVAQTTSESKVLTHDTEPYDTESTAVTELTTLADKSITITGQTLHRYTKSQAFDWDEVRRTLQAEEDEEN